MCLTAFPVYSQNESDFAPFSSVDGYPQYLVLSGTITDRAPLSFTRALNQMPAITTVVLASPGGLLQSGLIIAEKIHERGLNTLILPDTECASACAFLFLAGHQRVALGRLGVHQVYGNMNLSEAQLNLSDAFEMLDRFKVSPEVTKRMLRTPSDQMYWFSPQELKDFDLNSLEPSLAAIPAPAKKPTPEPLSLEQKAASFVLSWIDSSTSPTSSSMASTSPYADTVLFYDKFLSKSEVMADKANYAARWPDRTARVKPDTLRTHCQNMSCVVSGQYIWSVANPVRRKRMEGVAVFHYRVFMGDDISISEEGGEVLSKTVIPN
jgi:ATP-dependent protease ClpP protease subunit